MGTESGAQGLLKANGNNLKCFDWQLKSDPILKEDTNGTTGGHTHRGSVKKDHELTYSVYIQGTATQPEALGIIEGAEIIHYLRVGTLNGYNNWNFIIGPVQLVGQDPEGFCRYTVTAYAQEAKPALASYAG